jgi:hypothetical protein
VQGAGRRWAAERLDTTGEGHKRGHDAAYSEHDAKPRGSIRLTPPEPHEPKIPRSARSSPDHAGIAVGWSCHCPQWAPTQAATTPTGCWTGSLALGQTQFRRRYPTRPPAAASARHRPRTGPHPAGGARLPPPRIHDLRHTAVALWIAAGASPNEVSARAGHASVSFTLDRYGHLLPEADDALLTRLHALYVAGDSTAGGTVVELPRRVGCGPDVAQASLTVYRTLMPRMGHAVELR